MTTLPPLAPLPPLEVQRSIPSDEWELYLDASVLLLRTRLDVSASAFEEFAPKDESVVPFLTSFYDNLATSGSLINQSGAKSRTLRKLCFLLTRRLILETTAVPPNLLEWTYLSELCCCYPSSAALKKLLFDAWAKHEEAITTSIENCKAVVIRQLSASDSISISRAVADIRLLTILASSLPATGHVLMAGSEFLDTLADLYQTHQRDDIRKTLVANVYVGLTSLLKGTKPNLSLLLDQLFGLKASSGIGTPEARKEPTLLSDAICSSDLLSRLERYLVTQPQKRGQDLTTSLRAYQTESKAFHHRYQRPKKRLDKGKGRAPGLPPIDELHAHKMSLITQIQDLFPDLGSGYIVRLLDFYGDNPETIIAHLLDESTPPDIQDLDKSEQLPAPVATVHHDPLPPRSTPPPLTELPIRKNIFDNDIDLAELARSDQSPNTTAGAKNALRFGRANPALTADDLLSDRSNHTAQKAAIISALAAFDSDDDERDDTYDVADVGGTVDATDESTDQQQQKSADDLDLTLLQAYKSNPALFSRDSATRRGQPRASLKRETGMTDEAIEGWAVMLTRDSKRLAKLEDRLALSAAPGAGAGMAQPELASTSYRRPKASGDGEEESGPEGEQHGSMRGRGRGRSGFDRGRGRGRGGGGGGGGPSGDQNAAASRQRKEENKASRANHNRRQQRAKKVARAGGMVG
ncbi:hypothetical protein BJY00DRAFT_220341 [Aspergillus carlsbadensis]|nr:hypothetical protein BJY00DRAFT_220341 [Aspergillus carlsbadensis]